MNKTKNEKVKVLPLLVCLTILLSTLALPLTAMGIFTGIRVSAGDVPSVGFVHPTAEADENNMVSLEVSFAGQLPEGTDKIVVSYHTESATAIAGVDFFASSGTIELTQDAPIQLIRVAVCNKNRYLVKEGDVNYARYFTVVLDTAEGGVIDQSKKTAKASLIGGTQLTLTRKTTSDGTIPYFSAYDNVQHTYESSVKVSDEHLFQSWNETDMTLNNATTRGWVTDYINTGLAKAYGLALIGDVRTVTIRHGADFYVAVGTRQMNVNSNGDTSGLTDANAQTKLPGVRLRLDVDFHFFADWGGEGNSWTAQAQMDFRNGDNPYDNADDYFDIYRDNSWIDKTNGKEFYSYVDFGSGNSGSFTNAYHFLITPYQNQLDMRMTIYNTSSVYDKKVEDLEFDMVLKDFDAPRLQESYIDDSALATTGKLRLILRYNEPVWVPEKHTVGVKMGNSITVNYFSYVGGNYSDTQVYEFDTNGTPAFRGNITDNYTLSVSETTIHDLAMNYSPSGKMKNNELDEPSLRSAGRHVISQNGTTINYRTPVVSADKDKSSTFQSSYQLGIALGGYTSTDLSVTTGVGNGTVYYTWNTTEASLGTDASKYAFSGKYRDYEPLNISLLGKEELRLFGTKKKIGGEWVMQYSASEFVVDGVTYVMNKYDGERGNSFQVKGQSNEYTFSGVGRESFFIDNKTFIFEGSVLTIERAGTYYLHVFGISDYNLTKSQTFGPYKIDGSDPVITADVPNNDQLRVKEFNVEFYDRPVQEPGGASAGNVSGVDTVSIRVQTAGGVTYTKNIVVDNAVTAEYRNVFKAADATGTKWTYYSSVNDAEDEDRLDPLIYGLMEDSTRENLLITFTVTDKCGNSYSTDPVEYVYDMREGFTSSMQILIDGVAESPIFKAGKIPVYDSKGKDITVSFSISDPGLGQIFECSVEDEMGELHSVFLDNEALSGVIPEFSFTVSEPGYYEFTPQIRGKVDDNDYVKVSSRYRFYVTNGMTDETVNYQTTKEKLVLSNSVFQVSGTSTPIQFTYLNAGKKLSHYNYGATYDKDLERYVGGSVAPTFSDPNVAKKYFTFMEYQDLYLISLSDTIANALNNGGSPEYQKADDEPRAVSGQLWVRYKRSTWTPESRETAWVYYFYDQSGSEKNGINVNILDKNEHFTAALESVVKTIMSYGKIVNLVTTETTTLDGAPKVAPEAMHYLPEEALVTASKTPLTVKVSFSGDPAIYRNNVTTEEEEVLPLATNLTLKVEPHTQLYFSASADLNVSEWNDVTDPSSGWTRLDVEDGDALRDVLYDFSSGTYTLLELGGEGVSCFRIYVDKTIPITKIKVGENETLLDGSIDKIYGKTVEFLELTGEIDDQAYVAVFSYSGILNRVYYKETLPGLVLSDNNYKVQIGDRSGNILIVNLYLSTSPMTLSVEETGFTDGVTVTVTGRTKDEILRYEVKCNNEPVKAEFTSNTSVQYLRQTFRNPGIYSVYVEDIYGNKETREYNYKRPVPTVLWSYSLAGNYEDYNPSNVVCMNLTKDEKYTGVYNVYTSTLLRFRLDAPSGSGETAFEISGAEEGRDYTINTVTKSVSMLTMTPFELKVYYKEYPDNYETYNVFIDNSAPHISATYIGSGFAYEETDLSDYPFLKVGDRIAPLSLVYHVTDGENRQIENGEVIDGNYITVSVSDEAGIRSVTVELNGGEPKTVELEDGKFKINDYGEYVIRAVDLLGNPSVFRFTNTAQPFTEATLDGKTITCTTDRTYYGHGTLTLRESGEGTTEIIVRYGGESFYGFYRYEYGQLRTGWYELIEGESEGELSYSVMLSDDALFDISKGELPFAEPFVLEENDSFRLEATVDRDGNITYRIVCTDGTLDIETLYSVSDSKTPDYFSVEMSKEKSDVPVYSGAEEVTTNKDGKMISVGEAIWFDTVTDPKVTLVEIAMSADGNFTDYETLYSYEKSGKINAVFEDEGLYSVRVTNVYGNVTEYLFSLSKSFFISATVTYADGETSVYVHEDGLTVYLNNKVTVTAFAKNVTFTVNGVAAEMTVGENSVSVTLSRGNLGTARYEVVARDEGGVERRMSFVIGTDRSFTYHDTWLTGYNEDALLRDEDYTNRKLSVVWDEEMYQVLVEKDGKRTVVYDLLSQTRVTEYAGFGECVGNAGDGDYTVIFRNRYGDVVKKTVHYRETPTLILSRSTLAGGYTESYDLETALKDGFYSSNALVFDSDAGLFRLAVTTGDGNVIVPTAYPYILEFDSDSGNGSFEYRISYIDAYGFKYDFTACLLRRDLEIGTSQMELVLVEKDYYTRDNVAVTFADSLFGTVSRDGAEPVPYRSGSVLRADGTYRFAVTDVAGNLKTFTVTHDSVIRFTVSSSASGSSVQKGGVTNADTVVFRLADGDTGYIKHVIYNGVTQEDYTGNDFSLCGHWELLIEDRIGNSSYFDFYLMNHGVSDFAYTAPDGFTISEVWITERDGTSRITPYSGDSIHLKNEGVYAIVMTSKLDNVAVNFTVTVDRSLPTAHLSGCEDGEETARQVTIEGLQYGDTVEVYKNGELLKKFLYTSVYDVPTFADGGEYEITVTNLAGMSVSYAFTKKHIANTATSVLIIISCLIMMCGVFVGLIYRNSSKTDR